MDLKPRSPETDAGLDGVIAALWDEAFIVPGETQDQQRDALARALVRAAIDHELRIRIDRNAR